MTEPREERTTLFLSLLLGLIFFVVLFPLARAHPFGTYATETDFYQLFAPDAARLARGQFPENTFQGPGYPAALVVASAFGADYFTAGKWLSVFCAPLAGFLIFLLFGRIYSAWVGLGAQLLVFTSTHFPKFAINATTDVFFLLLCLAALVVLTGDRLAPFGRVVLVAVLSGCAYLTRYNGLFLVAVCLGALLFLNIYQRDWRERIRLSGIYAVVFLLVCAPWFVANYQRTGSPLYNTNYLNIATQFYPDLADNSNMQEGTRKLSLVFHSFTDVLLHDPAQILRRYPENLWRNIQKSVTSGDLFSPWVGWLSVLGLALTAATKRAKGAWVLLGAYACYFLIMSLTHWEARYYFFVIALDAGFAVFAVAQIFALLRARLASLPAPLFSVAPTLLVLLMAYSCFARARKETATFLASHPAELPGACASFARENIRGARLLGRKPHLAYFCGQEWVFFPTVKSIDELRNWLRDNPVDYVTISSVEISRRREFAVLKDVNNAPAWLTPVYVNQDPPLILYKVAKEKLDQ
ncbi:MAG TPA: glycosyltransferase family 39 protein [Pyrinomonadaceae bacterium]|nr:glycosyltransferase family 39 protein [Pyrinomonadaceae bacterium]